MDQEVTLKTLCQTVVAKVKFGAKANKLDDWHKTAKGYSVTLKYQGRRMTVDFWCGSAITTEPTSYDMLYCLLSDASANDMSFEDFCGEFGYDLDSRKAEETYKACRKVGTKVRKLLGEDFEVFNGAEKE
jgi:hypothetical protein